MKEKRAWIDLTIVCIRSGLRDPVDDDIERLVCSSCGVPFEDFCYLMEGVVDKYLARHLREQHGVVPPARDA